jgi:hypothetical protein
MIIVGTIDENFKNNLIQMKDIGYSLYVFYFTDGVEQAEHISILKKIGVECIKIDAILNKSGE